MNIGNVQIKNKAVLAPMAGISDRAFRELCTSFGASYTVSEMVSAKGISYKSKKSAELMVLSDSERPCGVQIFGDSPSVMAEAAQFAMQFSPDIIDINMGCPAPKIVNNGNGAALMKNPSLCGEIVKEVTRAVNIPVTVKIRKGWDENSVNAVEIAKIGQYAENRYFGKGSGLMDQMVSSVGGFVYIDFADVENPKIQQHNLDFEHAGYHKIGRASCRERV